MTNVPPRWLRYLMKDLARQDAPTWPVISGSKAATVSGLSIRAAPRSTLGAPADMVLCKRLSTVHCRQAVVTPASRRDECQRHTKPDQVAAGEN
jgi:hypothetical protein